MKLGKTEPLGQVVLVRHIISVKYAVSITKYSIIENWATRSSCIFNVTNYTDANIVV